MFFSVPSFFYLVIFVNISSCRVSFNEYSEHFFFSSDGIGDDGAEINYDTKVLKYPGVHDDFSA